MDQLSISPRHILRLGLLCAGILGLIPLAASVQAAPRDPLDRLLRGSEHFLRAHEEAGISPDPRQLGLPAESIRLTIVPQLLGYCELLERHPSGQHRANVLSRALYLLANREAASTGSASDGLLAYALLRAFETTGRQEFVDAAKEIANGTLMKLEGLGSTPNQGLMAALGLAKLHELTGRAELRTKVEDMLASLPSIQNPDGSFPHVCPFAKDVHYTVWLAMELILIRESIESDLVDRLLVDIQSFMQDRVLEDGSTSYQGFCPYPERCDEIYYERGSGCARDIDTRAWTNELAYSALLFDYFEDPKYDQVMSFLASLENRGGFPDRWDYIPEPEDAMYLWSSEGRSIIRTSVIFWALAHINSERDRNPHRFRTNPDLALSGTEDIYTFAKTDFSLAPIAPNPTRGEARLQFILPQSADVVLAIHDIRGRRVRTLARGIHAGGVHSLAWDNRDEAGKRLKSGVYFAVLKTEGRTIQTKLVLLR